jgi:ABC-type transport system involved in multi-copper enzyme maturation permease subunit
MSEHEQVSKLILTAGLVIIAVVLVMTRQVWLGALGHGAPSVWRIAKMTVAEARRRRVLQAVVVLALLFLISPLFFYYLSPHEQSRMVIDCGLGSIGAFGMLLSIFIGAFMIPHEIESRTIYPILAKPVRRFEFILGKYLGALLLLCVVVVIMTAVLVGVLLLQDLMVKDLPDSKFDPNLFGVVFAAVMSYFSLVVLTALIILISSVSSTTMTIIGGVLLWVVGAMQSMLLDLSTKVTGATKLLTLIFFYAVPPLQNFDFRMDVSNYAQLSPGAALFALERGLLYAVVALIIAAIFFDNRQV